MGDGITNVQIENFFQKEENEDLKNTTNAHVQNWDVKYKDKILTVEPIGLSYSLDSENNNGVIQNNRFKK